MLRLALTAFLFLVVPAQAQQRTDELLWLCEGRTPMPETPVIGEALCAQYLGGMNDLNTMIRELLPQARFFCTPSSGVSNDQLRLIFMKWAREHPEELHETARVSAFLALGEAFPCGP